jgi:hypothetical protein
MLEIYFPEFPSHVLHADTPYERVKTDYIFPTALVQRY